MQQDANLTSFLAFINRSHMTQGFMAIDLKIS